MYNFYVSIKKQKDKTGIQMFEKTAHTDDLIHRTIKRIFENGGSIL
jgi:hypothetical protein